MRSTRAGDAMRIAGIAVFCLPPLLLMALTAVSARPDFLSSSVEFAFTPDNFSALFGARSLHMLDQLVNSLAVAAASALAATAIAAPAAYAITRLEFRGRTLIPLVVLALSLCPAVSVVGTLYRWSAAGGILNTRLALFLPHTAWNLPLSLWILISTFAAIPRELDQAAAVDGCSAWQALRLVILPAAAPGLAASGLLAFIASYNEFLFALILTSDHKARTIPVGIALFEGLHGEIPWGLIMAAAVIAVAPVFALTVIFQRRIVEGLTQGAVKG